MTRAGSGQVSDRTDSGTHLTQLLSADLKPSTDGPS